MGTAMFFSLGSVFTDWGDGKWSRHRFQQSQMKLAQQQGKMQQTGIN